ncbi:histone-lysine N-methyltransferase SETMAR [Trichonephila clavipes]|nr:histone-lysine N-methyltransferase SETMAR [Trichonephila clavipes]
MDSCGDFIDAAEKDDTFLQSIVTGEEKWFFEYDPRMKRQNMEWLGPSSPKSRKFRFEKSKVKTMLITFFDAQGIHKEYVPEGQTVNDEFYCDVTKRLRARIHRVLPHLAASGKWFLLHDNALLRTAMCVKSVSHVHVSSNFSSNSCNFYSVGIATTLEQFFC